ncbi:MAG: tetratricopeptide repeat protein, partial [Spirochaetales bacterium]|nr:tetratricopeptide repeat protein [Spirochaetales bacterium]
MLIKKILKQALSYQNKDNKDEALLLYGEILKIDPVNLCALNNLGIINQESGDFMSAEKYYKKALKNNPRCIEAEYNLGLLYKQQGHKEKAVNVFESIYRKAKRRSLIQEAKQELKELTNNNYDKCDRCGDISILETAFRYTIRGRLCPGCFANPGFLAFFGKMIWTIFGIVLILLMVSKSLSKPYLPDILFINIIIFFLWFFILIFFHEFAHALAFYYLGGKVFEISIGYGALILQLKINNKFILSIKKIPDG